MARPEARRPGGRRSDRADVMKKPALSLILGLALAAPIQAANSQTFSISGRISTPAGRPAAVHVLLEPLADGGAPVEGLASKGRFLLAAPTPGPWRVVARAPGLAPAALDLLPLVEEAELPPLPMAPAAALAVRVLDAAGRPVPGAEVRAVPVLPPSDDPGPEPPRWRPAAADATADARGLARLDVQPGASLLLSARAPGHPVLETEIGRPVPDSIELRLPAGTARRLEVRSPDGAPAAGAAVETAAGTPLGVTAEDGRLEIFVPRGGALELRLLAPAGAWARAAVRPRGPDEPEALAVSLEPPRILRGTVLDRATGRPIPGSLVAAEDRPHPFATADPQGRFALAVPFGGAAGLRAAAPGYLPAAAVVREGERSNLRVSLDRLREALGAVVDPAGRPVAGADVHLVPSDLSADGAGLLATTSSAGRFRIERLAPGSYDLEARAHGFAPATVRGILVSAGGRGPAGLGTVVLDPQAWVEGFVVDPDGRPVPGARVLPAPTDASQPPRDVGEILTAADGSFQVPGFRAGERLTLRVAREGYAPRTVSGIEVPPPEPLEVVLEPAGRIAGTVVDESGRPVEGATVVIREPEAVLPGIPGGRLVGGARADTEGRFAAEGLPPGRFRLQVAGTGYVSAEAGPFELAAGEAREGVEVVLRRGAALEGRITGPTGEPVAGADVRIVPHGGERGAAPARSDGEGRYRLEGIAEGRRKLHVSHPGFLPAEREADVASGTSRLDFRLETGVEIAGRVISGASSSPVPGAEVRLLPMEVRRPTPVKTARSDPEGGFRFAGVPPGRYRLTAEKEGASGGHAELQVGAGPAAPVEIRLQPGATLRGRLLGLSPRDLAQVELRAVDAAGLARRGRVDFQGGYEISDVPPGLWTVVAQPGPSRAAVTGQVAVEPGQTEATLDLAFGAGYTLAGRVLDAAGAPVPRTPVTVLGPGMAHAITAEDGTFRIDGLEAGTYVVRADDGHGFRPPAINQVEISGETEIVLRFGPAPEG
jgi:protocatechuate 3,4-dioxygenase beta subunit